ncbi:hypothetical protein C3L33_20818, partial [Rhododendron williamsianum]
SFLEDIYLPRKPNSGITKTKSVSGGYCDTVAKMNDLMTKSFLSFVELKKQAMKDLEAGPDLEMGQLDPVDEKNLSQFFEQVAGIKANMEEITNLLLDLQSLNEETKSTHSAKVIRGLRDRINSDMVAVLRKAKIIKTKLELLDQSNVLKDMMNDFQCLREKIVKEHKEGLKRRHEVLKEIQRSLTELHQVFLDMAVLVETQGEKINDIQENVVSAAAYVSGGTKELVQAKEMKKRRDWVCWVGIVVLLVLLVCLIAILT